MRVIEHDGLAEGRRLAETNVAGNYRLINPVRENPPDLRRHLLGEVHSCVEHREQHSLDPEPGIEVILDQAYRADHLRHALKREVLALERDQHRIGRGERVDRQQSERRRTIDQDEVVGVADRSERSLESRLAGHHPDQLDLGAGQSLSPGHEIQVSKRGREDRLLGVGLAEKHLVDRGRPVVAIDPEPARGIALGVDVDKQDALAFLREAGAEIDGRRGLADATLLACYGDRSSHSFEIEGRTSCPPG